MKDSMNIAMYARVSSEHQAEARTIDSQIAALLERIAGDGYLLADEMRFIDDGYSGATLIRPGLERLRDVVVAGAIDRVYVHSPDRLARKYAYQVLLIDEFERNGVEVAFVNRELGSSPEDQLLLQVQGMVAEYERAKIIERHRRGKRHAAKSGSVNVLSGAPYGYRYVNRHEGSGHARYEVIPDEARVVRQVFDWTVNERVSIAEVTRRLKNAKEITKTGKTFWDRTSIWGMLKNPAYKGAAAFGKTRMGPMRPRLRAQRGRSLQPRRPYSCYDRPREEWITIAVPAIVDEAIFEAAQEQLRENQRHARMRLRGARYLLQGLINCACCGYAFYGKPVSNKAGKGKRRDYAYYRCIGTDAYRFGGQRLCSNIQVRTDTLDLAVWTEVRRLLENPDRLSAEYKSRLRPKSKRDGNRFPSLDLQMRKLRQGLASNRWVGYCRLDHQT
jgi:site-specific DNA recombinase